MKRSPIKRKSATKRRTTSPRCQRQRCNNRAEIGNLCVSHAEKVADNRFQSWVRERDGVCTGMTVLEGECLGNLQAAHIVGRRNHAVRYDEDNCHALCMAHHMTVDQHGQEHAKHRWAVGVLGEIGRDSLMLRAQAHTDRRAAIIDYLASNQKAAS